LKLLPHTPKVLGEGTLGIGERKMEPCPWGFEKTLGAPKNGPKKGRLLKEGN